MLKLSLATLTTSGYDKNLVVLTSITSTWSSLIPAEGGVRTWMFYKRYAGTSGHVHTVPNIWMRNETSVRFTVAKRSAIDSGLPLLIQCLGKGNWKPWTHVWLLHLWLLLLMLQDQSAPTWILVLASAPGPGGRTPAMPPLTHWSHQIQG